MLAHKLMLTSHHTIHHQKTYMYVRRHSRELMLTSRYLPSGDVRETARLLGSADVTADVGELLGRTRTEHEEQLQISKDNVNTATVTFAIDDYSKKPQQTSDNPFEVLRMRCEREKQTLSDWLKGKHKHYQICWRA